MKVYVQRKDKPGEYLDVSVVEFDQRDSLEALLSEYLKLLEDVLPTLRAFKELGDLSGTDPSALIRSLQGGMPRVG